MPAFLSSKENPWEKNSVINWQIQIKAKPTTNIKEISNLVSFKQEQESIAREQTNFHQPNLSLHNSDSVLGSI